jgi:hypothetical protein
MVAKSPIRIELSKCPASSRHKWKAVIHKESADGTSERTKTVRFGATGYEDYTTHKDAERKKRYMTRHKSRETWGKSGLETPGFWSRWILWNKPSLGASISDTSRRFGLKILRKR